MAHMSPGAISFSMFPAMPSDFHYSTDLGHCTQSPIWGFPKFRFTFLGVRAMRTILYWGLYWGALIQGTTI